MAEYGICMTLFAASVLAGFMGLYLGAVIGGTEFWAVIIGFIGFNLPYAAVVQCTYKKLNKVEEDADTYLPAEDEDFDIKNVPVNKCTACFCDISPYERHCPSCGLKLPEDG